MLVGQRDDLLPFPSMVEEGAGYWNADTLTMTRTVLAFSSAFYTPFKFSHTGRFPASQYTVSQINPIYYGLLTAARMLQSHAAVIPVTLSTSLHIKAHATIDEKHVIRILLINKEETSSGDGNVSLQLPRQGDAEISTLRATNDDYRLSDYTHYTADDKITLAGQSFKVSAGDQDGLLHGAKEHNRPSKGRDVCCFLASCKRRDRRNSLNWKWRQWHRRRALAMPPRAQGWWQPRSHNNRQEGVLMQPRVDRGAEVKPIPSVPHFGSDDSSARHNTNCKPPSVFTPVTLL